MVGRLEGHLLDILQADPRTYASGSVYSMGWSGVTRPDRGLAAQGGWVNIYDGGYEPSGGGHRPAIYLGLRALEYEDTLEAPALAGGLVEFRKLVVPLVIVAQAATELEARAQRDQLCSNVRLVLASHIVESGYWYELRTGLSEATAGETHAWLNRQGVANAVTVTAGILLPCRFLYVWTA
ncbi:hypothetical protein [Chthonomonas calidirosea]|uniref:hypothetical protein n=1 Tax=Chthonomonas calidirosea TaxID=454171 RepID=UPI0006EC6DA9|nr:hypothetical protein [Chthonomonas calidirosea]CEK16941.1 hypothetical protein CP488_01683 [Chthonomonas calidirosea]